jgi:Mg/Co/Ni transporter MgtE
MPTDHLVAMLAPLTDEDRARVEAALPPRRKADIQRLLAYGEAAVARLSTPKVWRCDRGSTVGGALETLRENGDQIEVAANGYVVDGARLVGVVALRTLAVTPSDTPIETVMTPDPIALDESSSRSDAAEVEIAAGLLLGLLLGTIAFGRALLWGVHSDLAACVAVTILVVCAWANAVGALVPLGAQKLGIDPTVVSAPLITTLVDASGLFIYFTVAHLMIAQLRA